MANTIIIKRSSVASDVPTAGQLEQGELGINIVDEKLYSKNSSNIVFELTGLRNVDEDLTPSLGGDLQSNGFDIDMADNDLITLGTSADAQILFDGTRMVIDVGTPDKLYVRGDQNSQISFHLTNTTSSSELGSFGFFGTTQLQIGNEQTSGTVSIYGYDSGAGKTVLLDADPNGALNTYYDGTAQTATQLHNGAGNSSGLQIKNHVGTYYDVGFNVVPDFAVSANDTFDVDHQSMMWHKNAGVAITLTCASTTDIPDGAMWYVYNDDTENLTIDDDATAVVYWLEAGTAKATGAITVEPGGIVTVYKLSLNEYWVWGAKEAGGGGGATTLNGLTDVTLTSPADGAFMIYDTGTSQWRDFTLSGDISCTDSGVVSLSAGLDDLTDVTLTTPADDALLIYDTGTAQWRDYPMTGDIDMNDIGVTTAQAALITGKTALASGLVSTDELLVSDAGVLKKMDISVIEAYMQANLTGFGTVNGSGTDNYIAVWNGTGDIDAVGSFNIANAVDKTQLENISNHWEWQDNDQVRFGNSADVRLYYDGVDDFRIDLLDLNNFRVFGGTTGTEAMFHALANGEFGAYYNGALKISTTSVGVNVTGNVAATQIGGITQANLLDKSATETVTGAWTFTLQDAHRYGISGDYSQTGGAGTWGATIWSIDSTWQGGTAGVNSVNTSVYGIRWLRSTHANAHVDIGEGLYVFTNGVLEGGIGTAGVYSAGDVAGVTIGGITQANLVDKAATETISGAWTFSNAGNLVSGDLEFQDNAELRFGTDNDVQLFHNGVQLELDLGTDIFYIREGVTNIAIFSPSSGVSLYDSVGTLAMRTQLRTTLGNTSSATVYDHGGTERDIGFNTIPTFNMNVSDTLEAQHCGHLTGKTNTTAYTLTGPASTDLDFPVGGVCQVANFGTSVNYTISDTASCTMYFMDGAAAPVDIAGSGTLAPGGWVTLYRYSSTAIYITGSGFTP